MTNEDKYKLRTVVVSILLKSPADVFNLNDRIFISKVQGVGMLSVKNT